VLFKTSLAKLHEFCAPDQRLPNDFVFIGANEMPQEPLGGLVVNERCAEQDSGFAFKAGLKTKPQRGAGVGCPGGLASMAGVVVTVGELYPAAQTSCFPAASRSFFSALWLGFQEFLNFEN
jgi:hypothetical protein